MYFYLFLLFAHFAQNKQFKFVNLSFRHFLVFAVILITKQLKLIETENSRYFYTYCKLVRTIT